MKARITKIYRASDLQGGLRDDSVEGNLECIPEVGKSVVFTAPPRDSGSLRLIETSRVLVLVGTERGYSVRTESGSIYEIEVLE